MIVSKPSNDNYRNGWDKIFKKGGNGNGQEENTDDKTEDTEVLGEVNAYAEGYEFDDAFWKSIGMKYE